ncbi:MAG: Polysaccharide export protein [Verrucomicrobiales bacterium]|nr:Polysaccharide export protein [Verrucomicrobiales bacterium]
MSDEPKLSFTELRRKRGESTSNHSQQTRENWQPEEEAFEANGEEHGDYTKTRTIPRPRAFAPEAASRRALPYSEEPLAEESSFKLPFDFVRILDALKETWKWWLGAGLALGLLGFFLGYAGKSYIVSLQLMRREIPVAFRASETGDSFKPQYLSETTLLDLLKAPEVLRRASALAVPPVSPGKLSMGLTAALEPGAELINMDFHTQLAPEPAVELLNLYANELVKFTQEMQTREAREVSGYLGEKLASVERELATVNKGMNEFPAEEKFANPDKQTETYLAQLTDLDVKLQNSQIELDTIDLKVGAMERELEVRNPLADKLQAAKDELQNLLAKYTDQHPSVQDQRARIKALEEQVQNYKADPAKRYNGSQAADGIYVNIVQLQAHKQALAKQIEQLKARKEKIQSQFGSVSEKSLGYANLKSRYDSLFTIRSVLGSRQREAQLFVDNPNGYVRVFTPASLDRVGQKSPWKKTFVFMFAGLFAGLFGVMGFVAVREVVDDSLRSSADVERATGLPILGSLGDLDKMTPAEQAEWAFRTWTIIKGKLTPDQHEGLVCGVMSARHGEGRSTWIQLLSATANSRGLRVLTVETRRTDAPKVHPHERSHSEEDAKTDALMANVLTHPGQVAKQLVDAGSSQIVHIPLPGWVWNLERRKQWQNAMDHWGKIENLVLLVELPPASEPESILLAEKLPQLIWLNDSGKVTAKETRKHMETLRHANCNLVGAVVNREPESFFRNLFSRWIPMVAIFFGLGLSAIAQPEQTINEPAAAQLSTNLSFSVSNPAQRAKWQQKLTLGPGDIMSLAFFGETNLTKNDVIIGPDGRLSYLQATIMATGLTVDELREKFDQELSKYYRAPRVMITPVSFHSKKFFILGKVMTRGVFALDRPITVIEALGLAHGFETAMLDRNSIDLADLQRSFLIRDGKRLPIDFEKLFLEGDLSQNIPVEPNDYFYFAPTDLSQIHVLGQVNGPGVVPFTREMTVIAAIAKSGGFAPASFKSRVVVIRGSLTKPQTFVVDVSGMTDGRKTDFVLKPRDIVYVSKRPFIRAEELLDIAATAFIQSATTAWAGQFVGPFIEKPFIHGLE